MEKLYMSFDFILNKLEKSVLRKTTNIGNIFLRKNLHLKIKVSQVLNQLFFLELEAKVV